mgnify:CR=1 FL=1
MPLSVGVPLIVSVLEDQFALTPFGSPVADPIPVAPVVVWVILVKAVLIHKVGVEEAVPAVLSLTNVTTISSLSVQEFPSVTVTV